MLFGSETQNDTRFLLPLNLKVVVSLPLTAICGRKDSMNLLERSVAMPKQERNEIGEVLVRRQAGELLQSEVAESTPYRGRRSAPPLPK
ncbi:hypothetical protein [Mesorhizobium sanjuanii]|uniref:hypothetical protein n=1 Tax=Mesorhizobium sanjuanii TaxID=2037900 RepID=UPI001AD7FB4E|nr:hypothetical protein [Mesorhizobium sanjuanii]